jgi:predicted XRE-type DNA-binding protein
MVGRQLDPIADGPGRYSSRDEIQKNHQEQRRRFQVGFSPAEARNLRLRSEMMTALRRFIQKEGLAQADAAQRLKVSQPRTSDLTRGKLNRFSLDALVNMLTDAGMDVAVRVRRPARRVAQP